VIYFSSQKSRVGDCTRSRFARRVGVRICVCVVRMCEHVVRAVIAWFTMDMCVRVLMRESLCV
jgi:hypothetical protein